MSEQQPSPEEQQRQAEEQERQRREQQTEPTTTDDTSKAEGRGSLPEDAADQERERREQTPGTPEHQRAEGDAEVQDEPDDDGTGVEPLEGDQGEYVDQSAIPANAGGFDPDRPVRTSPPTADSQSGVPQPDDGSNEGVEADEEQRGPQSPSRPELGV